MITEEKFAWDSPIWGNKPDLPWVHMLRGHIEEDPPPYGLLVPMICVLCVYKMSQSVSTAC